MIVKKGDLYFADLSPVVGSEQGGVRPVLVVQNDVGNRYSPTIIVAAVTSQTGKAEHINLHRQCFFNTLASKPYIPRLQKFQCIFIFSFSISMYSIISLITLLSSALSPEARTFSNRSTKSVISSLVSFAIS